MKHFRILLVFVDWFAQFDDISERIVPVNVHHVEKILAAIEFQLQ